MESCAPPSQQPGAPRKHVLPSTETLIRAVPPDGLSEGQCRVPRPLQAFAVAWTQMCVVLCHDALARVPVPPRAEDAPSSGPAQSRSRSRQGRGRRAGASPWAVSHPCFLSFCFSPSAWSRAGSRGTRGSSSARASVR